MNKDKLVKWIKDHKIQLVIVGVSVPTIIGVALGLKNKDAIIAFWDRLREDVKKANIYSSKWFETAADDVLSTEREKVRLAYCTFGNNFSESCRLQNLLWIFDKEMSKRAWGNEIPHAPSFHREHGWYLPNDN